MDPIPASPLAGSKHFRTTASRKLTLTKILWASGFLFLMIVGVVLMGSLAPDLMGLLPVAVIGEAIYSAPTIVAYSAKHRNAEGILILNLFLGWTLVGWVVALVWAVYKEKKS